MARFNWVGVFLFCLWGTYPALAQDAAPTIFQFRHKSWTSADGVPPGVWTMAQAADGYIWLGTGLGLYRFDGVHFEKFQPANRRELQGIDIVALAISKSGTIWVGYESGGVSAISHGNVINYGPRDGLSASGVNDIRICDDGTVWVGTDAGLEYFNAQRWRRASRSWSLLEGVIASLAVAGDGTLWVEQQNAISRHFSLYYLRPGSRHFIFSDTVTSTVNGFARDAQGRLWAVDDADGRIRELPTFPSGALQAGVATGVHVSSLMVFDSRGALWGTTRWASQRAKWASAPGVEAVFHRNAPRDGEFLVSNSGTFDSFGLKDGLPSRIAATLLVDREGSVWVGTNLSLDQFSAVNVELETSIPTTANHGYRAIAGRDGVYITADGLLFRVPAGGRAEMISSTFSAIPTMLAATKNGTIWSNDITSSQRKIIGWTGNGESSLTLPATANYRRWQAAEDDEGKLWISVPGVGVLRLDDDKWSSILPAPTVARTPMPMQKDGHGGMWLSYLFDGRLLHATSKGIQSVSSVRPKIGQIQVIYPYSGGTLFGGTFGLSRFDGRRFHTLFARDIEPFTLITGIVEARGEVFVNSEVGIVEVGTKELDLAFDNPAHQLDYRLLDANDGLQGSAQQDSLSNTAVSGTDSRLWFVTSKGVVSIDPKHLHKNLLPPPVYVRSVAVDDKQYVATSGLVLPSGTANVRMDFTALSFVDPQRVHFRYILDGVDQRWVDAGPRRQAFYTRLGPGKYLFRVIASNNDGVWNKTGASFAFTIAPAFYETAWFDLVVAIACLSFIWLLYALRLRQVSIRLRTRLEVRLTERERIARELHDTLLQGFQGLMLHFRSVAEQIPPGQAARASMDIALNHAESVLVEGRDRVRNLRSAMSHGDLAAAIASAIDRIAFDSETKISLTVMGRPRALHPVVQDEIIKIAEEAIFNAFQHSNTEDIKVDLTYDTRQLSLKVEDRGDGMDQTMIAQGKDGHFGLTGMRERAQKIGAELLIESRPGAGTEIRLNVRAGVAYSDSIERPIKTLFGRLARIET